MSWLMSRLPRAAVALGLGLACDPADPPLPEECKAVQDVLARFELDTGTWPATSDTLAIDAPCTVDAVLGATHVDLTCTDAIAGARPIRIALTTNPPISPGVAPGDAVEFHLRRAAADPPQLGAWTLRGADGELLLGANQSHATVPNDPAFFAPLRFDVDSATCPRQSDEETCYFTTHLLLTVDDGLAPATLTHGAAVDLQDGHRLIVERATQYDPGGDGKSCQVDDTVPATYRFLIAHP